VVIGTSFCPWCTDFSVRDTPSRLKGNRARATGLRWQPGMHQRARGVLIASPLKTL